MYDDDDDDEEQCGSISRDELQSQKRYTFLYFVTKAEEDDDDDVEGDVDKNPTNVTIANGFDSTN